LVQPRKRVFCAGKRPGERLGVVALAGAGDQELDRLADEPMGGRGKRVEALDRVVDADEADAQRALGRRRGAGQGAGHRRRSRRE
jgi:hypothetical protein